ncbi:hypothetical protein PUMCH_000765 [Australozyma saopauloensis]|uniref:Phospholipid/glycerol acyltransferase domain-containing protein n=1 Tax=Australozyma saopauloensis TaxID=291208 RepID=A0AAX4H4U2_9ASCO|nr:hypothetical protein PUMCH_000765 [[Candida] saopauloensis]
MATAALTNSDFDINILENALTNPNIELTFPLPTDKETYIPLETNEQTSNSFQLLEHFINFFSSTNVFEIYNNAEYRYSVKKTSAKFNQAGNEYMKNRLENTDEYLDEIVYKLVDLELKMNLIKAKDFPTRHKEVKDFMVKYYMEENKKNLPVFGDQKFVRLCYITVIKTISKMFPLGVWVNRVQFSNLYQKYLEDPMSIVLLPNHQSHIDYVILHLIMIRFQMSIPIVIAGDNLNVAVFGSILKGLGAIFIKRSFNNELYTERNLNNYIEFVFANKIHFEVFIEGTRSRDGKLLLPKYGILKSLASIYLKQRNQEKKSDFDLLIQPISITYERVYEADGYLNELNGMDKTQESFVNILTNGLSNMFSSADKSGLKKLKDGYVDNAEKSLNGKIYVKLAENFKFSSYVNDPDNSLDISDDKEQIASEQNLNLKKLGFKILHSVNEASYLPESALVGMTIQTFNYHYRKKEFATAELLPMFNFLLKVLLQGDLTKSNAKIISDIQSLNDAEKIDLIQMQIVKFLKYTKVNLEKQRIKIINSFELLYYKNLCIHLIIHRCLVSFILMRTLNLYKINRLYYIFTGFLKNEFLFDYDYNPEHSISNILRKYQELGVIDDSYLIVDEEYHSILATIIEPFIQSYLVCVDHINDDARQSRAEGRKELTEQQLIDDSVLLKEYPTTKSLLKTIQKDNSKNFKNESSSYRIETYNKQYLLSFLFYLNNLKLIKIFKNKAKTKAYVIIRKPKDLQFTLKFFSELLDRKEISDFDVAYMIDIVDKNFERSQQITSKL